MRSDASGELLATLTISPVLASTSTIRAGRSHGWSGLAGCSWKAKRHTRRPLPVAGAAFRATTSNERRRGCFRLTATRSGLVTAGVNWGLTRVGLGTDYQP